jgi:hypothetical protein
MGGVIDDILEDIGLDEVDDLLGGLDELIADVPVGALKDDYQKRRDACLEKSLPTKYTCLYDLFQDVKRALRDKDDDLPPKPTLTADKAEADSWGWVPWAVGGVAAAGVVFAIIQATKKG